MPTKARTCANLRRSYKTPPQPLETAQDPDALLKPTTTARKPGGRPVNSQPLHVAKIQGALLTLKNAGQLMGASEDTIRRRAKADPTFPQLVKLGTRCTRLPAHEFMAWLKAQGGAK